tara:strand:- start:354 stop:668 length:315 start_codon:yes stop_codon:yes gene_type:complete
MSNKDKIIERLDDTIQKNNYEILSYKQQVDKLNMEIEWWKRQNEEVREDLYRCDLRIQNLEKLGLENLKERLRVAVEGLLTIKDSNDPMHIAEKTLEEILPKND